MVYLVQQSGALPFLGPVHDPQGPRMPPRPGGAKLHTDTPALLGLQRKHERGLHTVLSRELHIKYIKLSYVQAKHFKERMFDVFVNTDSGSK